MDKKPNKTKSSRRRLYKVLATGEVKAQTHEWPGSGPCPFGDWWSEEKMNSMGNTWKV